MRRALLVIVGVGLSLAGTTWAGADSTTTTTTRPVPVAPLTGLPDPSRVAQHRPAVTLKVDNTPEAHPQYGIDKADVIYEEIVEGGITRLAAVFNSHAVPKAGPVRSVRRTDREVVGALGGIFVFSGGAQYALQSIATAPVVRYDESNAGRLMFRDPKRPAPHNLFANVAGFLALRAKPTPPPSIFRFRRTGVTPLGVKVHAFTVGFSAGYATSYVWDQRRGGWDRSIFSKPDVTADGHRMSPANVVVMSVHYQGGVGVEGSEADLVGSGPVQVFSAGRMVRGTWFRGSMTRPIGYRDSHGRPVVLSPGQTIVELLDTSMRVQVTT